MIGYWLQILIGSSSKLNYQMYKYILHLDMQNVYSTQWIRKIIENLQRCGLFNILVNQHNIRVEDSKAIRLLIFTRINDQYEQIGTLVYLHTLDAHTMYYLQIIGNWNHIYINYLPAIEYTYLNLM